MSKFFRFPHTPYIKWLGSGSLRGDKILTNSEIEELLSGEVVVEEKVDGANIGISLDDHEKIRVQNRGNYLIEPYIGQFKHLPGWLEKNGYRIQQHLLPNMIVFGEWCAARHSLSYTKLPDYFLLFDVYDKEAEKFWSSDRRNFWAHQVGLKNVPQLSCGRFSVDDLERMLGDSKSCYREGSLEGLVVRKDYERWNISRGKLVQGEFVQSIDTHWSSRPLQRNKLFFEKCTAK